MRWLPTPLAPACLTPLRWTNAGSIKKAAGSRGLAGWGPNAWLRHGLLAFGADWALDFTGTDRSAYLSTFSFSKRRVTFQRFRKKPLRKYLYTDFVTSSVSERHTADHYTDLLGPLGVQRENVPLDLRLRAEDFARARALLANAHVADTYVVVHAGAARRRSIGYRSAGRMSLAFCTPSLVS